MTSLQAPITRRSGIVVALPTSADRSVVYDLCAAIAPQADRFAAGERDVIAVFGFASGDREAAVAVSAIGVGAVEARPDVAIVLGRPVIDALRIDGFTTFAAPEIAVRAEVVLLRIARDIAATYGGLVCDDTGAIYAPLELDELVAAGVPRESSFTFDAAVSAVVERMRDHGEPERIGFEDLAAVRVSECAPDVALASASLFVVMGPHVPLVTATRIAVVAASARTIPVIVFAPMLLESDAAVLRAAAIIVARSGIELDAALSRDANETTARQIVPPNPYGRDEIALYAFSHFDIETARAHIRRRTLEVAELAGRGFADQPVVIVEDDASGEQPFPMRLARFTFPGTVLDAYYVSVAHAHPFIAALIAAREELRDVFDGEISGVFICESLVARDSLSGGADAFAISLLAELCGRVRGIAQDDSGALFDSQRLAELSAARRGRGESWSERVAVAGLFSTA